MLKIKVGDRVHWSSIRSGTVVKVNNAYKLLGVAWDKPRGITYTSMRFSELEKYINLGLASISEK